MPEEKIIMDEGAMLRALARLSHEIIERNHNSDTIYLVGIKRRGVTLARMIKENIEKFSDIRVSSCELDVTLYRDDLTERFPQAQVGAADLGFDVTNKHIILVDDVLFTGRTTRASMEAIISKGRPAVIELAVMVDRGHRELPICADYVGKNIPTAKSEFVCVKVYDFDGCNQVVLSKHEH